MLCFFFSSPTAVPSSKKDVNSTHNESLLVATETSEARSGQAVFVFLLLCVLYV